MLFCFSSVDFVQYENRNALLCCFAAVKLSLVFFLNTEFLVIVGVLFDCDKIESCIVFLFRPIYFQYFTFFSLLFCFETGFPTRYIKLALHLLVKQEKEKKNEMSGFSFIKWHSKQNKTKQNDGKQNRTIV